MAIDDITAGAHDNSNDGSTPGGGGEADRLGPDVWKITAVGGQGAGGRAPGEGETVT